MVITSKIYTHLIEDIRKWPIYQFALDNNRHKKALVDIIFDSVIDKYGDNLNEEISKCAYLELKRLKLNPWKVDPPDEAKFWEEIRISILNIKKDDGNKISHFHLRRIITRYVEEIFGDFKISTYKFARVFLTYLFNRIFNGFLRGSLLNMFGKRKSLKNKLKLSGYIDEARELFTKGTVVLLPTHQSNLDSIIIGYTIDYKLGIPAFSYGAGLNLFNYEIAAFYMSRLGAYKLDRRKKNSIYMNSLLSYSKYSFVNNINSIFFPGGTRSRSGEIETNLKTGLMSSLIEAQYDKLESGDTKKIFVIPVILNYNSVLEAKPLIYSYLKRTGKKDFLSKSKLRNRKATVLNSLKAISKIFVKESEFVLSLGKPMDVFGNIIDNDGNSFDLSGNKLDITDYFKREGKLVSDNQRDIEYTKILAKKVVDSYLKYNVIFASHLVAYIAFNCFINKLNIEGIYDLLKYKEEKEFISVNDFKIKFKEILNLLKNKRKKGEIIISDELDLPLDEIINTGISKLGVFHINKVLFMSGDGTLKSEDFGLLYYYSNRLSFLNKESV